MTENDWMRVMNGKYDRKTYPQRIEIQFFFQTSKTQNAPEMEMVVMKVLVWIHMWCTYVVYLHQNLMIGYVQRKSMCTNTVHKIYQISVETSNAYN